MLCKFAQWPLTLLCLTSVGAGLNRWERSSQKWRAVTSHEWMLVRCQSAQAQIQNISTAASYLEKVDPSQDWQRIASSYLTEVTSPHKSKCEPNSISISLGQQGNKASREKGNWVVTYAN